MIVTTERLAQHLCDLPLEMLAPMRRHRHLHVASPVDLGRDLQRVVTASTEGWTDQQHAVWTLALQVRGAVTFGATVPGVPTLEVAPDSFAHYARQHLAPALAFRRAFRLMPGIGSLAPEVVLVGEQPNPRTLERTKGMPFAYGGAGEWLFRALREALPDRRVYLTNAIKADGDVVTMPREIRYLEASSSFAVIALGKIAAAALTRAKIAHVAVDHPQHARRFHHHESYGEQLAGALTEVCC